MADADLAYLESELRALLRGQHSSLTLSFNEANGPNYRSVAEFLPECPWSIEWVSEEERQKAIALNSMWQLQWYPEGNYILDSRTVFG